MKLKTKFVFVLVLLVALCAIVTTTSHACPSCYGDARSSRFDGMNAAILTMIGITGTVFAGFGGFFLRLRKRMRMTHLEESDIASAPEFPPDDKSTEIG